MKIPKFQIFILLLFTVILLSLTLADAKKSGKKVSQSPSTKTERTFESKAESKKKLLKTKKPKLIQDYVESSTKELKNKNPIDVPAKKVSAKVRKTINTTKGEVLNKIINGIPVKPNAKPHMASFGFLSLTNYTHLCGGSIVTKQHIVTAAHCVTAFGNNFDYEQYYLTNGRLLVAVVGVEDLTYINILTLFKYKNIRLIVKITFNTDYNKTGDPFDVAVLKLDEHLKFSSSIQPINLPYTYDSSIVFGRSGCIAGWGTTEAGILSKYLLYAYITIVNTIEIQLCGANGTNFYCVLDKTARKANACFGDSGGPLVVYYNYKPYLFGIASFANIRNNTCVNTLPSFYTMVPKVLFWIKKNLY